MVEQWQIDRNQILKSIEDELHNIVEGLSDITQLLSPISQYYKDKT